MVTTDLSHSKRSLLREILKNVLVSSSATAEETFIGDNLEHIYSVDPMLLRVIKEAGALSTEIEVNAVCLSFHNVNSLYVFRSEGIYMSHNSYIYYTSKVGKVL